VVEIMNLTTTFIASFHRSATAYQVKRNHFEKLLYWRNFVKSVCLFNQQKTSGCTT